MYNSYNSCNAGKLLQLQSSRLSKTERGRVLGIFARFSVIQEEELFLTQILSGFHTSSHLLCAVLLDTAVDVAQCGSGQHERRLLVDQSVQVSLNLQ